MLYIWINKNKNICSKKKRRYVPFSWFFICQVMLIISRTLWNVELWRLDPDTFHWWKLFCFSKQFSWFILTENSIFCVAGPNSVHVFCLGRAVLNLFCIWVVQELSRVRAEEFGEPLSDYFSYKPPTPLWWLVSSDLVFWVLRTKRKQFFHQCPHCHCPTNYTWF